MSPPAVPPRDADRIRWPARFVVLGLSKRHSAHIRKRVEKALCKVPVSPRQVVVGPECPLTSLTHRVELGTASKSFLTMAKYCMGVEKLIEKRWLSAEFIGLIL
jgi:hypothetical protein